MQTTLLAVAIAIIVALVTALAAPLVVDWNQYRSVFEKEASRVTGLTVRVNGAIDARILPTPRIKLHNVEIGPADHAAQARAGTVELEIGLGPLLRGEVRATEMHVVAPQIKLGLDRSGAIAWPISPSHEYSGALTVSRLAVEDGRVTLTDAGSGSHVVLQNVSFNGEIRSLPGLFRGEGAFAVGDDVYGYRLSGSRPDDSSALKLRLSVDPADYPLTGEVEGSLAFDRGVPQFDGTLALGRPAASALARSRRVMSSPWHVAGKLRITPASAVLQNLAFQYGPEERPIETGGRAEFTFGEHPHLAATLTARQLDLDRALAAPEVVRRPPLVTIKGLVETLIAAIKLPIPATIGVGVEALTFGGTTLQALHGDFRLDNGGWTFRDLAFRAPGATEVKLSGRLDNSGHGLAFNGPVDLGSTDIKALLTWLEGRGDLASGAAQPFRIHGDVTLSSDRIVIDHLASAIEQANVSGRLAYTFAAGARPAAVDGELRAAELDVDALAAFAKTALANSTVTLPRAVALNAAIGKATFAGVDARNVDARVKFDAGVLHVERFWIGDLGGASLDISGHLDELSSKPRGSLTLDLDAKALAGLAGVVGGLAPKSANSFRGFADRLAPAKLHGVLTVDRAAAGAASVAKFDLHGQGGALRVNLTGEVTGEPDRIGDALLRLQGKLDADDGGALLRLLGLDRIAAVDQRPGRMTLAVSGPLGGEFHVSGAADAGGFSAALDGTTRLSGSAVPTATLQAKMTATDLRPLHRAMTGQTGDAVPVVASAAIGVAGANVSLTKLAVAAGKASLHGRLAFDLSGPLGVEGDIAGDNVDGAVAAAILLGLPGTAAPGAGRPWSAEPVGPGAFMVANGAVTFALDHAAFAQGVVVRNLKGVARFARSEIVLGGLEGGLAGGHLAGELAFRHDAEQFAAHGHLELAGADAAAALWAGTKTADGSLTVKFQGEGEGRSPEALVRSLHGSGTIALTGARFAGLSVSGFDAAIRVADRSGSIDAAAIRTAVASAVDNASLSVTQGSADVTAAGGQVRLANAALPAQDGGELSPTGLLDLSNATIDARLTLSSQPPANALVVMRPEFAVTVKGPLGSPRRALDVSALTSWLTLRAAEVQVRRLESVEANRRQDMPSPVVRPPPPVVRFVPPGTALESGLQVNALPPTASRSFDRLRPDAPVAETVTPDEIRAGSTGTADRGAASAALPPSPSAPIKLLPTENGPAGTKRAAPVQPAPRPPAPAARSLLDFLFRSQN